MRATAPPISQGGVQEGRQGEIDKNYRQRRGRNQILTSITAGSPVIFGGRFFLAKIK